MLVLTRAGEGGLVAGVGVSPVRLVLVVERLVLVAVTRDITVRCPVPHISRVQLLGLCTTGAGRIEGKKSRVRLVDITCLIDVTSREVSFGNFIVTGLEHLVQVHRVALGTCASRTAHFGGLGGSRISLVIF